ncbi:5-formyltetrahydrofolate cyclo-ligase [Fulvivirga sp. RKSG066]|uniref:5-formyltetrahydrofolate cyclo-ligase n=1 Tax=Fulvivirga aurantia TaxID=2529383 RepID=UPI0012BC1C13|nr:5-formyltetrahydrofolate cyclo-ligase [Fulvivirga aurantia]MTI22892.1 5-formyltetrahydrofolate cyclo-ligase [Fulvivirga aurantia]
MVDKNVLRKVYLEKRLTLSDDELETRNINILKQTLAHFDFSQYKCIHTFLSMVEKKEVNTHLIVAKATDVNEALTVVTSKTLKDGQLEHYIVDDDLRVETNKWGIPQPVQGTLADISKIDIVLVPLIAFDKVGHRIGYGKGYYDRFLKKIPHATKVGVSLSPPLDLIPYSNEHDVELDFCITPHKVYKFQ